ncbi:MAG: Ig-like domain-containing protein [Candidatus Hodarchaeales archaeon]
MKRYGIASYFLVLVFMISVSSLMISSGSSMVDIVKDGTLSVVGASTEKISSLEYRENAWIWVSPDGYIHAQAEVMSPDLSFGEDQNLNILLASYGDLYNLFDWAEWHFNPSDSPLDMNSGVSLDFRTNDPDLARQYADLIMEFVSRELIVDYVYDHTYSWEDWREDQWTELTTVHYNAHVDWPWFTDYINNSIVPRDIGGLSETIDITSADWIQAWAWRSGWEGHPQLTFSLGFNFQYDNLDFSSSYFGSHQLSLDTLIHVDEVKKSPYQSDDLYIRYNLPNVTSLTHFPSSSSAGYTVEVDYHPSPEAWVDHHFYDVNLMIHDSSGTLADYTVDFDYDFIPWYMESRVTADISVNAYGYKNKVISVRGEYSSLIDYDSLSYWDNDLVIIDMVFRPQLENLTSVFNTYELYLYYSDYEDHYDSANNVALAVADQLGVTFNGNNSESFNIDWWGAISEEGNRYNFYSSDFNMSKSNTLLESSEVFDSTDVFENQDLTELTEYWTWGVYFDSIGKWINTSYFMWNPLTEEIANPVKSYSGPQTGITVDLLADWGWSSIPRSDNYSRYEFDITVPVSDYSSYAHYPGANNGWGWNIHDWSDRQVPEFEYATRQLEVYSEAEYLNFTEDNEPVDSVLDTFSVTFDFDFYDDSADLFHPYANFYYYNSTSDEDIWDYWYISNEITFSGVDNGLHVEANDDNSYGMHSFYWSNYFWNGTDWERRFGASGIDSVSVKAYYSDLPVDDFPFANEMSITLLETSDDGLRSDYAINWDTTEYADGEWTIVADVTDKAGYTSRNDLRNLLVDNYDDDTYTQGPVITLLSAENTSVSGTHTVEFSVTDDIEVFAVVLTRDGSGWIMNDENADGVYEFNWYTMDEWENSVHYFTVTAWDIEGHKTIYGWWLEVDNTPEGNPPVVEVVSPVNNSEITGDYLFQVNATDDIGVVSVKMKIDSGADMIMAYNPATGYYERQYNVSELLNGPHVIHYTVIDADENQHTVSIDVNITVTGGQTEVVEGEVPEWNATLSVLPDNIADYVQSGTFLDYQAESGEIYFKIAARDDIGIADVIFRVYTLNNFNPATLTSFDPTTYEPSPSDISIELEEQMQAAGTDGTWEFYEYTWNSTTKADFYYVCEIEIQDSDSGGSHSLYIRLILETDNFKDEAPPSFGVPGFEFPLLVLSLVFATIIPVFRKKRSR